MNLIANSIKFCPSTNGKIIIDAKHLRYNYFIFIYLYSLNSIFTK